MKAVVDFACDILRLLGLLDDAPSIRKSYKRSRVYDDFSSDDETPVLGYKQMKRSRFQDDTVTLKDGCDKKKKHSNHVSNMQIELDSDADKSTLKESTSNSKVKTMPVVHLERLDNRPSTLPEKTTPVTHIEIEEPDVTWLESNSENNEPPLLQVDLDDDDSDHSQQDDVIFVKCSTSPTNKPQKTLLNKNSHYAEGVSITCDLKQRRNYRRMPFPNIHIKLIDRPHDSESHKNVASLTKLMQAPKPTTSKFSLRVRKRYSGSNDKGRSSPKEVFNSDKKLHLKFVQQAETSINPMSEMVRDGKLAEDTASSILTQKTNETKLQNDELHAELYHNILSKNISDNRVDSTKSCDSEVEIVSPESSLASSVRVDLNSDMPDESNKYLQKQDFKYRRRVSDITHSCKQDNFNSRLSKLESKCKTALQKSTEKLNDAQHKVYNVSKVNSEQNEKGSYKSEAIRDWLSKLESKYKITLQEPPEKPNDVRQKMTNVLSISKQDKEGSYKPGTFKDRLSKIELESKYKITLQEPPEKPNDVHQKMTNVLSISSKQNEEGSYKSDTFKDWLSKLESKNKITIQKTPLNDSKYSSTPKKTLDKPYFTRQELNILSEVDTELNGTHLYKPNNSEDCLSKLECKYNITLRKTPQNLDDDDKTVNNVIKVNSEQNKAGFYKLDTTGDFLIKLGSLYDKDVQETPKKLSTVRRVSDNITLKNREQKIASVELTRELSIPKSITEKTSADVELPTLTLEQKTLVMEALEPEPQKQILVEKFNLRVYREDLRTFSERTWLNDKVINFYMNLIMQRSEERKDLPKVYATNTFFYPKLMQSGQAGLRRWTKKVDIFTYDLFMVPVNLDKHWCLSIVDFRTRQVKYLNSLRENKQDCLDALLQYLRDEHQDKKGTPFDDSGWKTDCPKDIPQQMNSSDCGMFACTFAEFSSRNAAYTFTQAHMPYLRQKAALEILNGKLLH